MGQVVTHTIDIAELLQQVLGTKAFGEDGTPFRVDFQHGDLSSRLIIITGDNCTGKSLMCRVLRGLIKRDHKISSTDISMALRTDPTGVRVFVYSSSEHDSSTGAASSQSIIGAFKCTESWERRVVVLDEAEVGLSEGYQAAAGRFIDHYLTTTDKPPELTVIATHSRVLVRELLDGQYVRSTFQPHHIRMGGDKLSLREFVEAAPKPNSAKEFEELFGTQQKRLRVVSKILKS